MNSKTQRTYDQVFQHPMTHNLEWGDVRAMFESFGEVEEEHNGNQKATLSGHSMVFQSPTKSDVMTPDQVSQIRHLLHASGKKGASDKGENVLLVIDHHQARIFHPSAKGSGAEVVPSEDPEGFKSHVHSAHDFMDHNEKPDNNAYFSAVSKGLEGADKVLIYGSGTGSSSAMGLFVAWLGDHDGKLAERVVGSLHADLGHLTEGQLLAMARDFYAA